jgi:hypothetical protein
MAGALRFRGLLDAGDPIRPTLAAPNKPRARYRPVAGRSICQRTAPLVLHAESLRRWPRDVVARRPTGARIWRERPSK